MDENRLKFGVGVLVISSIGVGIILTFLFGAFPSVFNNDYTLNVSFDSAEGIGLNTAVYRDGVPIGRVSGIKLQEEGGVLVTLAMQSDQRMTHRYVPQIGSGNFVTGDAKLEFVRADLNKLPPQIRNDPELLAAPFSNDEWLRYGEKTPSLFEMQSGIQAGVDSIQLAAQSIAAAGESVNQLAIEVRQVVDGTDGRIDGVSKEAVEALEEFQGAVRDVRAIIGNPKTRADLEASIAQLPVLLQDARSALGTTQKTFESFERVGNQFERVGVVAEDTANTAKITVEGAQKTFANLERFTQPFADRGEDLASEVGQTLEMLQRTLTQVEQFGNALNNSNGSVKRFLEDDELYYQVRRTVENIELATARIRPILDDVRVFSDKIARDPRQLGVRGALTKQPNGLGLK